MKDNNNIFLLAIMLDLLSVSIYINVYEYLLSELKNPYDNGEILSEYLSYFINKGGITGYEFEDDIINTSNIYYMLSITKSLIKNNDFILQEVKKGIKLSFNILNKKEDYKKKIRNYEKNDRTEDAIKNLDLSENFSGNKNNNYSSDICIYVIPLGYYYNNNTEKLIENCVKLIKLTHNNVLSILGGIASAFVLSLSYNKIDIKKWIFMTAELLNTNLVKKELDLNDNENMSQYVSFMKILNNYLEIRFLDGEIKTSRSDNNLIYKMKFYNRFVYNNKINLQGEDTISCLIISYDALLNCNGNFEKLLYYSIITLGNTIGIGSFVGELYNSYYGINNVPKHFIEKMQKINDYDDNLSYDFYNIITK